MRIIYAAYNAQKNGQTLQRKLLNKYGIEML